MKKKKKKALIAIGLILSIYLSYKVYEYWPAEKTENWKMCDSLIRIWPRLKSEGIENIKFCFVFNPQTRFRGSGSDNIKGILSFRVIDANIVKWWTLYQEVPKDCLPECVNIIDKAMKGMWCKLLFSSISGIRASEKMLIVTKKGKYIVTATMDNSSICSDTWKTEELKCGLIDGAQFVPPKEQIVSIVIFRQIHDPGDRLLDFNPVALLGDKKMTEKLFGKTLTPKLIFEGRDELDKIVDEYNASSREKKQPTNDEYCLIFVTKDWFYWKAIYFDANTVYDRYMASKPLKAYFDELSLTKELYQPSQKRSE
ncbi:MAG: hypothetical protein ABR969_00215 [Sedimentisphaerales bacterium]|jgi:hypothetical protein